VLGHRDQREYFRQAFAEVSYRPKSGPLQGCNDDHRLFSAGSLEYRGFIPALIFLSGNRVVNIARLLKPDSIEA
jgi:hypothetical protein